MNNKPTGVLLLQMGGPDSLEDIPAFLYNLFSDRDIIKLGPRFLQKPLARLIAGRRAPKSKAIYARIGGYSPLKELTIAQSEALEKELSGDGNFIVEVAMRYWQPTAEQAMHSLAAQQVEKIILLPLYPHYTKATSGSSLKDAHKAHGKIAPHIHLVEIPSWPEEPHYLSALAQRIEEGARQFGSSPFQLVYSAHSLPVSFIEEGDPYVTELERTIRSLETYTHIKGLLAYQSRSGPVEWLAPSTTETIDKLAKEGCQNILMMPISFVSDHVETLYEINMEFKDRAAELGMHLTATKSLNADPLFIKGLRSLVIDRLSDNGG